MVLRYWLFLKHLDLSPGFELQPLAGHHADYKLSLRVQTHP